MEISRGDLVVAAFPGDYGKPRPALVIQSDGFTRLPSVTVLPLTSDLYPAMLVRINVAPTESNGLQPRPRAGHGRQPFRHPANRQQVRRRLWRDGRARNRAHPERPRLRDRGALRDRRLDQ